MKGFKRVGPPGLY